MFCVVHPQQLLEVSLCVVSERDVKDVMPVVVHMLRSHPQHLFIGCIRYPQHSFWRKVATKQKTPKRMRLAKHEPQRLRHVHFKYILGAVAIPRVIVQKMLGHPRTFGSGWFL